MEHKSPLLGNMELSGLTPAQKLLVEKRERFVLAYCKEREWDAKNLSVEQLLEIRKQEGWKNPQ
ncbi:MAG: hypothetical protein Q7R74_00180 [bacterium]|nr:hypothetical protein [bacterium]